MVIRLKAEARQGKTKGELNELRAKGKIPAIVYGKNADTALIAVSEKELLALLRSNPHAIVEMDVPEAGTKSVLINEVQRDTLFRNLLHIDFQQINMDEPIKTTVRIEITGEPSGVKQGGMAQIQLHELEVRCLPTKLPSVIQVDISRLELGDTFLVSDIKLDPGIEVRTEGSEVVATILATQKEVEDVKEEPEAAVSGTKEEAGAGT